MAKVGAAALISLITISIASSYLFSGSPQAYNFVVQVAGCVFAAALLVCILKGLVFGFDNMTATTTLSRVLSIDAIIILTVFIISQINGCASSLLGA